MRLTILALFLSTGSAALCQSAQPAPANPPTLTQPQWAQPGAGLSTPPRDWHFNAQPPQKTIILPAPVPLDRQGEAQIDPKMIVHPPQSSLGEQAPGTQIAQNLYPGLVLQRIEEPKAKLQQIPITWPNLKVQNIPTTWSKLEIKSAEKVAATKPAEK